MINEQLTRVARLLIITVLVTSVPRINQRFNEGSLGALDYWSLSSSMAIFFLFLLVVDKVRDQIGKRTVFHAIFLSFKRVTIIAIKLPTGNFLENSSVDQVGLGRTLLSNILWAYRLFLNSLCCCIEYFYVLNLVAFKVLHGLRLS